PVSSRDTVSHVMTTAKVIADSHGLLPADRIVQPVRPAGHRARLAARAVVVAEAEPAHGGRARAARAADARRDVAHRAAAAAEVRAAERDLERTDVVAVGLQALGPVVEAVELECPPERRAVELPLTAVEAVSGRMQPERPARRQLGVEAQILGDRARHHHGLEAREPLPVAVRLEEQLPAADRAAEREALLAPRAGRRAAVLRARHRAALLPVHRGGDG